jgi:hypothetical protein
MPVTTLHSVGVGLKKPLLPAHAPTSLRVEKEAREKARTRPALCAIFHPSSLLTEARPKSGKNGRLNTLWRRSETWPWCSDQRWNEQGLTDLQNIRIGEVIGSYEFINCHPKTFCNRTERVTDLHDIEGGNGRGWSRRTGVCSCSGINVDGRCWRDVENNWEGRTIVPRGLGQTSGQSYSTRADNKKNHTNPELVPHSCHLVSTTALITTGYCSNLPDQRQRVRVGWPGFFRVLSFGSPSIGGVIPTNIMYPLPMLPNLHDHLEARASGSHVRYAARSYRLAYQPQSSLAPPLKPLHA